MAQELTILSPEKTVLTFRLAGIGSRALAHFIDVLIVITLVGAIAIAVQLSLGRVDSQVSNGIQVMTAILGPFAYFILLEGLWNGQTVGKKAMKIRVRMLDGTPVRFWAALGRNLLRPADLLPLWYFAGLLTMFTNPRSQRIGDLVANTIVIYELRALPIFSVAPHRFNYHPLEDKLGDLRHMTETEYAALRRYCDRFPQLLPKVQQRLTQELWMPFADRHGIESPPDIHPIYLAEAAVMKFGRTHGLL